MNYKDAGVHIQRSDNFVRQLHSLVGQYPRRTETRISNSGYGASFVIPSEYASPVIVTTTDGVGTKVKLATQVDTIDTEKALFNIGIDVVAMCVNDLVCEGAEPIHFLDYYATSNLDPDQALSIMKGIVYGCEIAGCELAGGETAEMPGMYQYEEFDIAGFVIGVAERFRQPRKELIQPDDVIIGLGSYGIHSNGYSLIRKILDDSYVFLNEEFSPGVTYEQELLKPTKIYVKPVLSLIHKHSIILKGIAHITGGGLYGNIPRILPDNVRAVINQSTWEWPTVFNWIKEEGEVSIHDMYETYNCGIGMVLVVGSNQVQQVLDILADEDVFVRVIGTIEPKTDDRSVVIQNGHKVQSV